MLLGRVSVLFLYCLLNKDHTPISSDLARISVNGPKLFQQRMSIRSTVFFLTFRISIHSIVVLIAIQRNFKPNSWRWEGLRTRPADTTKEGLPSHSPFLAAEIHVKLTSALTTSLLPSLDALPRRQVPRDLPHPLVNTATPPRRRIVALNARNAAAGPGAVLAEALLPDMGPAARAHGAARRPGRARGGGGRRAAAQLRPRPVPPPRPVERRHQGPLTEPPTFYPPCLVRTTHSTCFLGGG